MTADLLELSDWLGIQGVKVVAMESTGSYRRPVFNLLEPRFEVVLVNAHHIKQVPGRKTDVKDSEWIAHRARSHRDEANGTAPIFDRRIANDPRNTYQSPGSARRNDPGRPGA